MKKSKRFNVIAFAFLGLSFAGGPAVAGSPATCPGFTAEMLDAALLSLAQLTAGVPIDVVAAVDDPAAPSIQCELQDDRSRRHFLSPPNRVRVLASPL